MNFKGIVCAMVTPFDTNQKIDKKSTHKLIDYLIDKGISGLFILGTNGEAHMLSNEEKIEFAKIVIEHTKNRVPVFVGTGSNYTYEVIDLSKKMENIGANAVSIITPSFVPLTQEELFLHYETIAKNINIPIILYNFPSKTGMNIEPETLKKLANIENIIGIKDSSGNINNMISYINETKALDFKVFSGSDSLIYDVLEAGGAGAVSATSNFLTEINVAIYDNFKNGNFEEAKKFQQSIEKFRKILKVATIPSVLKQAITFNGINVGLARTPVIPLKDDVLKNVENVVKYYKDNYNI